MALRDKLRKAVSRPSHTSTFTNASQSSSNTPPVLASQAIDTNSTLDSGPYLSTVSEPRLRSRSSSIFNPFRSSKTPRQRQLEIEKKYADWRPPHKLKYPGKPNVDTVNMLEAWDWNQARRWSLGSADEGADLSPTTTRWTDSSYGSATSIDRQ